MAAEEAKETGQKAKTGIAGLDNVLGGGLSVGHVFLLEANPGTGKTTAASSFLLEGAKRDETCLYITLSETDREFDLLITDYSMPRMTGDQLAKAVRELKPGLPILLATGYAELPQGFDIDLPRLSKPYQQEQLAAEIAKLLQSKTA